MRLAGVGNRDVDPAVRTEHGRYSLRHVALASDIDAMRRHGSARTLGAARRLHLGERRLVAAEQRDIGAGAREVDRDRASDTTAGAGHDRDPAGHETAAAVS